MIKKEIRTAINDFIDLLENGLNDDEANIRALELNLDRLALAYHFAGEGSADSDSEAPPQDYDRLRRLANARFPGFGYYNEPKNVMGKIGKSELITGDALDDIADISRDLYKVLWYWEHENEEEALWQFCFGYEHHWGAHLRSLQNYLYSLLYK